MRAVKYEANPARKAVEDSDGFSSRSQRTARSTFSAKVARDDELTRLRTAANGDGACRLMTGNRLEGDAKRDGTGANLQRRKSSDEEKSATGFASSKEA